MGALEILPLPAAFPQDELTRFYMAVLPALGAYCIFLAATKRHVWAESLDELGALTRTHGDDQGVYFGTASFKTRDSRKQSNVRALRALRLDIDSGAKKFTASPDGAYPTQEEAVKALVSFCKAATLAPSFIVSSGEGLHVYFCLDEDVSPEYWLPLAEALGRSCAAHGLKVDPTVTTDTARVLRPPGTLHPNGKRVEVRKGTGKVYSVEEMRAKLPAVLPARKFDTSVNDDVVMTFEGPPSSALKAAEHCGALREVAEAKGDVPEPHWRAMLGIVKHTVEGEDIAQEWSAGYDGYDERETARKLAAWSTGPTTCAEFGKHSKKCTGCQYAGKIKSPIVLGRMTAPEIETLPEEKRPTTVFTQTRAQLHPVLPDWSRNFAGEKLRPLTTTANLMAIAPACGWNLRFNVMTKRTELASPGMRSTRDDNDNAALAFFGDVAVRAGMARTGLAELIDAAAGLNPYHPAQEWVTATAWDSEPRRELFHDTLELADPRRKHLCAKFIDAWMLQGIAAFESPEGVSAQFVLVLAGGQGVGKTRWVSGLCPLPGAVRTGLHIDPMNKDSVLRATGCWIGELGELETTLRREVAALKAFLSNHEDVVRPPYARRDNTYRRRTVFCGTVNSPQFLQDDTGNRRFLVLAVKRCHLLPEQVMQQVWAEYRARYLSGERWHLDAATMAELNAGNEAHTAVDPLRERLQTTFDWSAVDWAAITPENWKDHPEVQWATATDICALIGVDRPTRSEATRVGSIVSELNLGVSPRKSHGAKLLAVPAPGRARG